MYHKYRRKYVYLQTHFVSKRVVAMDNFNKQSEQTPYIATLDAAMADVRLNKLINLVLLLDTWNDGDKPDTHFYRVMTLRFMPSVPDLHIIFQAAQHLGLVGDYQIEERYTEGLPQNLSHYYKIVRYSLATEEVTIDKESDRHEHRTIHISEQRRLEIWVELFWAAGYNVKVCSKLSQMLNVKAEGIRIPAKSKDLVYDAITYAYERNHIRRSTINPVGL